MPVVAVTRTPRGWSVVTRTGAEHTADLVEGLSLADLVAEDFGISLDPDRNARRSARGPVPSDASDCAGDPRIAALERTVAQLEHALAARVSTERAIGVLAERHGTSARVAFECLRQDARRQGRPVHELARAVLDTLCGETPGPPDSVPLHVAPEPGVPSPDRPRVMGPVVAPHVTAPPGEAVADGRP